MFANVGWSVGWWFQAKDLIDAYRVYIPLFAEVANPAMQPHHWSQVNVTHPTQPTSTPLPRQYITTPDSADVLQIATCVLFETPLTPPRPHHHSSASPDTPHPPPMPPCALPPGVLAAGCGGGPQPASHSPRPHHLGHTQQDGGRRALRARSSPGAACLDMPDKPMSSHALGPHGVVLLAHLSSSQQVANSHHC